VCCSSSIPNRVGRESAHIPLNPAADSESIRPPLGAPRRKTSVLCLRWPTSVRFGRPFAYGFSFQRDLRGVVHEPFKHGIGQRRLTDRGVPVIDRKLTGHEGGPPPVSIIKEFQERRNKSGSLIHADFRGSRAHNARISDAVTKE
jgi:hypothetical protein